MQTSELSRRIYEAEKDVKHFVADHAEEYAQGDVEAQQRDSYPADEGSDDEDDSGSEAGSDESVDAAEDRFQSLEEEVANLVADVHDLALYTKLNITGFMKILKVGATKPGRSIELINFIIET